MDPQAHVVWQLRDQARSCAEMGSPLYARLLDEAAKDVEAGGPAWTILSAHVAPGRGDAVALRLMAAVHRLVLSGRAPPLAEHYPSAGGTRGMDGAWEAFRKVLDTQADELQPLVSQRCQTNEVGRCAALAFGLLEAAAETGLPLRLLEVGASAGLNLRWDRFHYEGGGVSWGEPTSPVDLSGFWTDAPPRTPAVTVVARQGCDLRPLDPTVPEDQLALRASVWADQVGRFERLRGALDLASRIPATVDPASLDEWLPPLLAARETGVTTVVYHSVVEEYLSEKARGSFHATLREAGTRATLTAPLAWVRVEPISDVRSHGVTLTLWPGGGARLLATCGAHGTNVVRAGPTNRTQAGRENRQG